MTLFPCLSMGLKHMPPQCVLRLKGACALVARLFINMSANVWFDLEMLALDMCLEGLCFSERLVARRVLGAVELGRMHILVPLQPSVGGEALPASIPIAHKCSFGRRVAVRILQMALQMVFARERLVASRLGTRKRSFVVVASHVCFEATWPVESLRTHGTDVIPLSAGLALCPRSAIVGEVYFPVG